MTPTNPLRVRCSWCGSPPRETCRAPSNAPCEPHAARLAAVGVFDGRRQRGQGNHASDAVRRIRAGALCQQELVMRGDDPRLDAWRVRVACACLTRVQATRGAPIASEILTRWPTPSSLALAIPRELRALLEPLGLPRRRAETIHAACLDAIYGVANVVPDDCDDPAEDHAPHAAYAHDAVRLLVLHRLESEPADKALRAVRERELDPSTARWPQAHRVGGVKPSPRREGAG